jgi:hypothetical protein
VVASSPWGFTFLLFGQFDNKCNHDGGGRGHYHFLRELRRHFLRSSSHAGKVMPAWALASIEPDNPGPTKSSKHPSLCNYVMSLFWNHDLNIFDDVLLAYGGCKCRNNHNNLEYLTYGSGCPRLLHLWRESELPPCDGYGLCGGKCPLDKYLEPSMGWRLLGSTFLAGLPEPIQDRLRVS